MEQLVGGWNWRTRGLSLAAQDPPAESTSLNFQEYPLPERFEEMARDSSPVEPSQLDPKCLDTSDVFVLEEIRGKRVIGGEAEYFLKWKGYGEEDNTWERIVGCPDLTADFEWQWGIIEAKIKEANANAGCGAKEPQVEVTGFDRDLQPEKIISAVRSTGELMFLMKWKGTDKADLVPAREANVKCPQVVIAFYERNSPWKV